LNATGSLSSTQTQEAFVDSYRLEGRTALATGGARGFGAGIAGAFARACARVVIADVLEHEGQATAGRGPNCRARGR
jgi:NAD(P)-dependent dehydrogenase (short-subunit alcohol dehydrogenase family)